MNIKLLWQRSGLKIVGGVYLLLALVATLQDYHHPLKAYNQEGARYTEYNNFVIFRNSTFHLLKKQNLYQPYPAEQWDLYKYSPAFSLFFGMYAWLPVFLGLLCWSLTNALLVFGSVAALPNFSEKQKAAILAFSAIELLGSIQNTQSNGLMAGLIIFAFVFLEKKQGGAAAFCIVFSIFIKIFGALALSFFLFYPNKFRHALYTVGWILAFALLPGLVTGFGHLSELYDQWWALLKEDHAASQGLSLVGILDAWFHSDFPKLPVTLLGGVLFCLPLLRWKQFRSFHFRLLFLSSALLWMIVFNHKSESPTFILSLCGMGIWYFSKLRPSHDTLLFALGFILTSLSVSDLCPRWVLHEFIIPFRIKAVMSVVIWVKVLFELWFYERGRQDHRPNMSTAMVWR